MTIRKKSVELNKEYMGVKIPSVATLKKYGISAGTWAEMMHRQGGVCFICRKVPPSKRLCIDHLHVRGWRRMKPQARSKYVRGLLCTFCNFRLVNKSMTLTKAERVVLYLRNFETQLQQESN